MQNEIHTHDREHPNKRKGRTLFDNFGLGISIFMLIVIVGSFRLPTFSESGSGSTGRNIKLFREYSVEPNEITTLESKESGDNQEEERASTPERTVDLNRLAKAVAVAESGWCTSRAARRLNNCHGIMTWVSGTRELKKFNSTEESFAEFKYIWEKSYKYFPDEELAKKWVCGGEAKECEAAEEWLANVIRSY